MIGTALVTLMAASLAQANNQAPGDVVKQSSPATSYDELRFGLGGGVTSAGKQVGEEDEGVAALNVAFVNRDGKRVLGANLTVHSSLFGATHAYFGGLYGFAIGADNAHLEVTGEGGVHMISGMGDDLFSSGASNSEASLPYVGAQVRAVFDIGDANGWQLELSVQGRSDLFSEERQVSVQSCFLGCSTEMETWQTGGVSANALAGLSYQFN